MTEPSTSTSTCDDDSWFKSSCDGKITILLNEEDATLAKPRLATAYWSIRGLGAPLRMMLCAAKMNFVVYLYDLVEEGEHGWTSNYFAEKASNLVPNYTPFMNLPCVVDEEEKVVLTQLNACLQYVGNICGMMGKTPLEQSVCLQFLCDLYDLRCAMTDVVYGKAGTVESTLEKGRAHFARFDQHLQNQESKCFTVGNSLTAPDFHLFELIDQYDHFSKANGSDSYLMDFPNVVAFFTEFSQLEYV
jgi:glutathione S-transferase